MKCIDVLCRYVCVTALLIVLTSLATVSAQTRVHEVKQGETLVSIAQAYQMTATELRVLNKLANDRIELGQKLRVRDVEPIWPSTSSQATTGVGIDPSKIDAQARRDTTQRMTRGVETPAQADTSRTSVQPTPPKPAEDILVEREHLVQPGETLFSIANQYGILVADLKRRNGIVGNDITAGQRLKVLAPTQMQQVQETRQVEEPKQVQTNEQGQEQKQEQDRGSVTFDPEKHEWYIVKSSDTLPSIARNFGMSIAQMRELNGSMIYTMNSGDRIIVFRTVEDQVAEHSEPPTTVQEQPPIQSQPPTVDLKPPVEQVKPPPFVSEIDASEVDSTFADSVSVQFDPFGNMVNRGRFIGHVVKRNERLSSILEAFQMDESDFFALNPSLEGRTPRTGVEVLVYEPPTNIQPNPYSVDATTAGVGLNINASVYIDSEKGKLTTSGELYNPDNLTAASAAHALGSILYVLNPETGKGTYVRVNDKTQMDGIMLSRSAATVLGLNMEGPNKVVVSKEN